ncbi:hypothetical protein Enr13x_04140 [Stieleria neptunia]|uniref:Uncharacterized protein n=1 Tax=Stieleria neptunia TaxID=2527979 RepID=A0A518HIC7_9BACT|nr:hypothetical protein Enr13x_04140 [Stieleria neptunia]
MGALRDLKFETLGEAVDDARQLLASGYVRQGNWSLAQICRHLVLVQDPSVDGYPAWMSLFAPLRPLMRRLLLPKCLAAIGFPGRVASAEKDTQMEGLERMLA